MCFESKNEHPYESFDDLHLNYRLCGMQNAREMHLYSGSNLLSRIFGINFVNVTVLQKKLLNSSFDDIFCSDSKSIIFTHCSGSNTVC